MSSTFSSLAGEMPSSNLDWWNVLRQVFRRSYRSNSRNAYPLDLPLVLSWRWRTDIGLNLAKCSFMDAFVALYGKLPGRCQPSYRIHSLFLLRKQIDQLTNKDDESVRFALGRLWGFDLRLHRGFYVHRARYGIVGGT